MSLIVKVVTLGCKVNQVESAEIIEKLNTNEAYNINASTGLEPADVYVLNTCSVTAEADRKSRQYVGKMRKLNGDCKIIVVGCSSQNKAEIFNRPNVVAVGGTANKTKFVTETIYKAIEKDKSILSDRILLTQKTDKNTQKQQLFEQKHDKTREFIKIQDGCNRFCTYCIIPYLRGRSRSIEPQIILEQCKNSSSKEIVLTGIDISVYGKDIGTSLTELVKSLSCIKARKRLGSLECEVVDDELLAVMKEGNYCPHFHLSLQSGSTEVLKTMNRHYDTDYFASKVRLIREYFPLAGITTDVIVGFPTETEDFFKASCDFIVSCGFSDIHVFPYSSRRGTLATLKYRTLSSDVVDRRVKELLEIKHKLKSDFIKKNIGLVAPVYFEEKFGTLSEGYTPNYIKVYADAPCGDIIDVQFKSEYNDGMIGDLI